MVGIVSFRTSAKSESKTCLPAGRENCLLFTTKGGAIELLKSPLSVQLEVTDACNYKCPHCYHLDNSCQFSSTVPTSRGRAAALGDNKLRIIADKIFDAEIFSLILTGGEPFLRPRICVELVAEASSRNILSSINTNLSLLKLETLAQLIDAGLSSMLVSCPSTDPDVYSQMTGGGKLKQFEDKLNLLKTSDIRFTINMVVNKVNLRQIRQTAQDMADKGISSFAATPMSYNPASPLFELALSREEVSHLADDLVLMGDELGIKVDLAEALPKCLFSDMVIARRPSFIRRQCQAGRTTMSVGCDGSVRPCSHNQDKYGNLATESICDVWARMESWRNKDFIPPKCGQCAMLSSCLGGCRVNAKTSSGNYQGEEPWSADSLEEKFPIFTTILTPIKYNTMFVFANSLRWRMETEDVALVCTRTPVNTTAVSKELLEFIRSLNNILPMTFGEIAETFGFPANDPKYLGIMQRLEAKEFIFRSNTERR